VDNANGAAVRIAMTVGVPAPQKAAAPAKRGKAKATVAAEPVEALAGHLLAVTSETTGEYGEVTVTVTEKTGQIHADLTTGANVSSALELQANTNLTFRGVTLMGSGFWVEPSDSLIQEEPASMKPLRNGKDLADQPRGVFAIDFFGLTHDQARAKFPAAYQRVLDGVKPERDQSERASYRDKWWLFAEARPDMRKAINGLQRYIATPMTAKHRIFQFLSNDILADQGLVVAATDDAFHLGIISSSAHITWALNQGGTLEDRPRYNNSRCFETFPFPDDDTGLTPALRERIASLAEQIDAHRKRQQAAHPGLTLTGMYNVLEALRAERELTAKEKTIHTQGLVAVLASLHAELDAAVLSSYGLPATISTDALLTHLVQLNAQRAAEEAAGHIRWLRPAFQDPRAAAQAAQQANGALLNNELLPQYSKGLQADLALENDSQEASTASDGLLTAAQAAQSIQPWPAELPAQVRAVSQVLSLAATALTLPQLEAHFKGRGPWKNSLPRILATLEALGKAQRDGDSATERWRA
jgi:hypothetical protein